MILKRLWAWDRLRKKSKDGKRTENRGHPFCVAVLSMGIPLKLDRLGSLAEQENEHEPSHFLFGSHENQLVNSGNQSESPTNFTAETKKEGGME
jgi:hypothetical protein